MARKDINRAENPAGKEGYDVEATLKMTGVSTACLVRYERASIVAPVRVERRRWYQLEDLRRIRKANRLQRDLGINLAGVEVVLRLTEQIAGLQERIATYEAESHKP